MLSQAPNPSIERTISGKLSPADHVERLAKFRLSEHVLGGSGIGVRSRKIAFPDKKPDSPHSNFAATRRRGLSVSDALNYLKETPNRSTIF
jgi:hypothetical protein